MGKHHRYGVVSQDVLDRLSARLGQPMACRRVELPMIPLAALRVYRASRDPNVDLSQVAAIIQTDQCLAGEVIRAANSCSSEG